MRSHKRSLWVFGVVVLAMASASRSRAGLDPFNVTAEDERKVGEQAARDIERKARILPPSDRRARIVASVGRKLVEASGQTQFKFEFKVIEDKTVNAFALPGGFIYIYTGMQEIIGRDVDRLAGVLGHETTHVTHHHWAKQYEKDMKLRFGVGVLLGATEASKFWRMVANVGTFAMEQKYSRKDEYDADDGGIDLMYKAGYDPDGMVELLEGLAKVGGETPKLLQWTSTHPPTKERIERAEKKAAEVEGSAPANSGKG